MSRGSPVGDCIENLIVSFVNELNRSVPIASHLRAGDQLNISLNTVRDYIRSIYDKLHVHSKSEAVAKALRSRLIH
jgi:hypothetical protein